MQVQALIQACILSNGPGPITRPTGSGQFRFGPGGPAQILRGPWRGHAVTSPSSRPPPAGPGCHPGRVVTVTVASVSAWQCLSQAAGLPQTLAGSSQRHSMPCCPRVRPSVSLIARPGRTGRRKQPRAPERPGQNPPLRLAGPLTPGWGLQPRPCGARRRSRNPSAWRPAAKPESLNTAQAAAVSEELQ